MRRIKAVRLIQRMFALLRNGLQSLVWTLLVVRAFGVPI